MITLSPLIEFLTINHPIWVRRSVGKGIPFLEWHDARQLLAISAQDDEVYGICTIRLFSKLEDFLEPWAFDPDGQFCFVDLLVAVSPLAIADCFEQLVGRWGPREIVIWDRSERTENGSPRMYLWKDYIKLTRRLTYGAIDDI